MSDPFWRPGTHILGAGVAFFKKHGSDVERPIVETDQLTLEVTADTAEREDSVGGARFVADQVMTGVRQTLVCSTLDVIEQNLDWFLGAAQSEVTASSSAVQWQKTAPEVGGWYQIRSPLTRG